MKKTILIIPALFLLHFLTAQNFEEVSAEKGISASYGLGHFCGGLSFCDFNGDGWDDLTFTRQEGDSLLFYLNEGGVFKKIPSLVPNVEEVKQALWADYDNDGDKDLFVTALNKPNRLYRNDGNLALTDVTELEGLPLNDDFTYGAMFGDYNNDGWLDLYVFNRELQWNTNYLFENQGDGTFLDVSVSSGTDNGHLPSFCGTFFDFNGDGWQDIYIAEDKSVGNILYKNTGNGSFENVSASSHTGTKMDAMNVGIGDYDNDMDLDIYVTNGPIGNKLYRNEGDETFTEVAEEAGVAFHGFAWAGNFLDADLDGDLDLYVCSSIPGSINPFYMNLGDGTFAQSILPADFGLTYSNVIGDFNQDGKPDIAVSAQDGTSFRLWENKNEQNNHWLRLELEGTVSNRDGIGSWIEIYTKNAKQLRYTNCGIGYLGQNAAAEIIGLGTDALVDSIKIKWLSGMEDFLVNISANQTIRVVEGSTTTITGTSTVFNKDLLSVKVMPNPTTNDSPKLEVTSKLAQRATLQLLSMNGKKLWQTETQLIPGTNNFVIPYENIPAGTYLIFVKTEKNAALEKLVVM